VQIVDRKFLNVETPTCHASSIVFFKNEPIYTWFGGIREGLSDSTVYIQFRNKVIAIVYKQLAQWNPILFSYKKELFLFIKVGKFCDSWQTFIYNISNIFEEDFDLFSIDPQILPAGLNGPTKSKPIIDDRSIYCGSSTETFCNWTSTIEVYKIENGQFAIDYRTLPLTVENIMYQDIYGRDKLTSGIIQPSLWVSKIKSKKVFHAFFRSSRGLGKIYHSFWDSREDKMEWSKPQATKLPNPNSGIDTVFYDGRLFLVYNPSEKCRYPLVIHELNEEFEVKDELIITEKIGINEKVHSNELSYPYMIEHGGKLYLTYTYGRTQIETVEIGI